MTEAIAYFDGARGRLASIDEWGQVWEIVTTRAYSGHSIKIDDGSFYPQLHVGGSKEGPPLIWASEAAKMGEAFAHAFGARLYRTHREYQRALEQMH